VLSCAIGLVCYRVGALSGMCAIYFVCYRDVGYRVGALSGIVSIFRVLSRWCAIAPCANGTRSFARRLFSEGKKPYLPIKTTQHFPITLPSKDWTQWLKELLKKKRGKVAETFASPFLLALPLPIFGELLSFKNRSGFH